MTIVTETKTENNCNQPQISRLSMDVLIGRLPNAGTHLIFWPLLVGGLFLDLWSKKAAFDRLGREGAISVVDNFLQFVRAENNGAAFGLFAGRSYLLTAVSAVAIAAILGVFLFGGNRQKLVNIALGLFAAGVCGNLYDRAFNGGLVRDFIDVYYRNFHWHTFNVADALLCIGVGLLVISSFFIEQPAQKHDRQQK